MIHVFPVLDPGLGNTAYVVDLGDGSALVVDPERDPRPYLEVARRQGLVVRHVAETHLHADFVSGARELVALGASLIAPQQSALAHPHRGVAEGDELAVGDLMLQVLETPGHTPEHVAYLLTDGSSQRVLFSGGTLMAGGVARPDLISEADTVPLARLAFRSVRRMLETLPVETEVRPTHGAGSFCSSPEAQHLEMTTVAVERFTHPAMTTSDEDMFVDRLLSGLGSYPSYFLRLREVNRVGPRVYGVDLRPLLRIGPDDVEGHTIVDVRPIERFSTGHIPGSISIALRDQFGTWLGWLLEPDASVVFVIDPDQDERELIRQVLNVGYENIIGRIDLAEWRAAGRELATIPIVSGSAVDPTSPILDVRQDSEWSRGHLPDASHLELGALAGGAADVGPGTIVHCGHGQRAMTAASLLARAGNPPSAVTAAGYNEIQRAVAVS
jgi:glyoxylase-like metal-dependent hydrolase (beta-lactamase superfamily II)/rhodanese-related sulfurtransferase